LLLRARNGVFIGIISRSLPVPSFIDAPTCRSVAAGNLLDLSDADNPDGRYIDAQHSCPAFLLLVFSRPQILDSKI
jgi:hypothetical protein